jgi:hypothetical protein
MKETISDGIHLCEMANRAVIIGVVIKATNEMRVAILFLGLKNKRRI